MFLFLHLFEARRLTGDDAVFIRAVGVDEFLFGLLCPLFEHLHKLLKSLADHGAGLAGRGGRTLPEAWRESLKSRGVPSSISLGF